jgi:hypothetical protein
MRNRGFIEKYRDAFRGHLAELANVFFPFGTYWMSKFRDLLSIGTTQVGAQQ